MKPYWVDEQGLVTLYCGDSREILPQLEPVDCIITDPVWPNSSPRLIGADRPAELFAEVARYFPRLAARAVIQLGCDSDPRFLQGMPAEMPYFRTCWLEYACPTRKGRVLYSGDVAYVFGTPPPSIPGRRVISGRFISARRDVIRRTVTAHKEWGRPVDAAHPTPRRYEHVAWLVGKFANGTILDPFAGSGTTLLAAKAGGYKSIGIEINEEFCKLAITRLHQGSLCL